jgi:hypothetical protein
MNRSDADPSGQGVVVLNIPEAWLDVFNGYVGTLSLGTHELLLKGGYLRRYFVVVFVDHSLKQNVGTFHDVTICNL